MNLNPLELIDGYKLDHRRQYHPQTTQVFSNFTPRKTRRGYTEKVVFFGLQYYLKEYLIKLWDEKFFKQDKETVINNFKKRILNYTGRDFDTDYLSDLHDLGYLPLSIYALPEGSVHDINVPCLCIFVEDSRFSWLVDSGFSWLVNYLESSLSCSIWQACTSATTAYCYRKLLNEYALETVGSTDFVGWQGHDFSFRGMGGHEGAALSGAGHLLSFTGTDTLFAIPFLEEYYNADASKELVGGTVPATEHSVASNMILALTKDYYNNNPHAVGDPSFDDDALLYADREYLRHLMNLYPTGIFSTVSDTFDYWKTITETLPSLKEEILKRDGKVVVRPDSGDPVHIICGYNVVHVSVLSSEFYGKGLSNNEIIELAKKRGYDAIQYGWNIYKTVENYVNNNPETLTLAEVKGSVQCLWDTFGGTISEQGYKVLDPHIGLIYGDSITFERCSQILERLKQKGFASTNVVFGIGSFTYQYVTRDTDGYAMKATYCELDGEPHPIYKKPKTDSGVKNSAMGLLAVFKDENGNFVLKQNATWEEVKNCEFNHVFQNGKLLKDYSLAEIRETLQSYMK
jgi:nicotinamide phosphoribosyltransferase